MAATSNNIAGFSSLLVTQFLGAANDNIHKQVLTYMVATGLWQGRLGDGSQAYVALCLTLPFILLSGFAGQVCDRYSKRTVMLGVKIAEIPIAIVALVAFWFGNLGIAMLAMVLYAVQSTFFGPAKYGVVPELVTNAQLSRANGILNMATNVAIITGTLLAGPISDRYFVPDGNGLMWLPGVCMIVIAILGLGSVLLMPKLTAGDPTMTYTWNPFSTYVQATREMAQGPILIVALAWSFFYLIGMIALLALPDYQDILQVSFSETSYLLGALAISIGVGSVVAGLVSGDKIRVTLVPIGAVGLTISFAALGLAPAVYWVVFTILLLSGFSAGFYIVPLQALLQKLSPDDERGRFLGTANAMSFVFSSAGAGVFWLLRNVIGLPSNRVFLVSAVLAFVCTGLAMIRLRHLIHREV